MCFYYFSIISPWGRTFPLIWSNLNPHQPRMLCAKFNWYWSCGSREKDFKKLLMCFRYFAIIVSPMGRAWLFIGTTWITWIPLYPKVLCAKKKIKKWNDRFFLSGHWFLLFCNYLLFFFFFKRVWPSIWIGPVL